ncbi:[Fe-Fe] hydrogenase large subunit C-terminal domain-containing protein [Tenuifilum thalassicum]|uniref:PAS domain-containing protein n=1 Tax=Tenuifilum thalassicum TaxID=2590900 RepID=A0A7D3XV18_9BACT|nr:[Fe-Fe] hydrogenase large subunit C-terminal domain-containing protein [Tenuifilum thalassicum]QKG79548.1 PAS domain-containing protein [Tenuifilum thalassicum]
MNLDQPIYTEKNNCQDCYKCVRNCPVKAIKIADNCASVIDELCISCAKCVQVCPVGAKQVRADIDIVKLLIRSEKKVILSIAPSWISSFRNVDSRSLISALKKLGFFAISETALGAELVNRFTRDYIMNSHQKLFLSSACPVVVEWVNKYYSELSDKLLPVLSPLLSHAKYLKEYYGPDAHVVFAGPCIAKKREADRNPDLVDACITFRELQDWMDEESISFQPAESESLFFEPVEAVSGASYPIDGGMISGIVQNRDFDGIQFFAFSGIDAVKQVLTDMELLNSDSKIFIELMSCTGGCINGPGAILNGSIAQKHSVVVNQTNSKHLRIGGWKELAVDNVDISARYKPVDIPYAFQYSENEIVESLRSVGKQSSKDELNCGGCGYESCRDFAVAMLDGKAERNMCISYMRRVAQDKATALLQRMPSGVIIVDDNLRVIECNRNAAKMLGDEVANIFDENPGLARANAAKLLPFHKLFSLVLSNGHDILDKDVTVNGKKIKVSIFTIQAHKIVCAIMRDLSNPDVRSDEIIARTRYVIKENLETVQQIAYLLGENASRTETMLNSIMELYVQDHDNYH